MYLMQIIKNWYRGKLIEGKPTHTVNENGKSILHLYTDYYKQPLLAKILKPIGQFFINQQKRIVDNLVLAIIAGIVTGFIIVFLFQPWQQNIQDKKLKQKATQLLPQHDKENK